MDATGEQVYPLPPVPFPPFDEMLLAADPPHDHNGRASAPIDEAVLGGS